MNITPDKRPAKMTSGNDSDVNRKLITIMLASMLGGTGLSTAIQIAAPVRDDPFTGKQGERLEKEIGDLRFECLRKRNEINVKIDDLQDELHDLELDVRALPPVQWRRTINRLERGAIRHWPDYYPEERRNVDQ